MALTNAVRVCHAFPRHAIPPQALVHVIAGVAILHPVVRCRGDNEEYVPHSCTEQPTSHEAVHPEKREKKEKLVYETKQVRPFRIQQGQLQQHGRVPEQEKHSMSEIKSKYILIYSLDRNSNISQLCPAAC